MASYAQSFGVDGPRGASWKPEALASFSPLSPPVQKHLQRVYATLAAALLAASVGVYAHILLGLGGLLTSLAFIGATVWLMSTPNTPSQEGKRFRLLMAAAALQGCSIGTLVEAVLLINPGLVLTAMVATTVVFACFTGAALLAKRREYLFIGAIVSSALTLMATMRLATFFLGGAATMYQVELYGGLLVFVGYILFDTQMIVERADLGDRDYVKHALDLFVDIVAIFVRILVILAKNAGKEQRREERRSKSGNTRRR